MQTNFNENYAQGVLVAKIAWLRYLRTDGGVCSYTPATQNRILHKSLKHSEKRASIA